MQGEWGSGIMTVRSADGQKILQGYGRNKMYEVEVLESGKTIVSYPRYRDRPVDILTWH